MLSVEEKNYFDGIVNKAYKLFNINVPIESFDHEQLDGRSKNALGCVWKYEGEEVYKITIDEYFIQECYSEYARKLGIYKGFIYKVGNDTLEHTLAHELAHMVYWKHGKKHTELTSNLEQKLIECK